MQCFQVEEIGYTLEHSNSVLEAALCKKNCISAFRSAGFTFEDSKQYHPEWLLPKFDAYGLLKPSARLLPCVQDGTTDKDSL